MVRSVWHTIGTVCFVSCTNLDRPWSLPHGPLPAGGIEPQRGEEPRPHPPWSPPTTTESTLGTCRGLSTEQDCNPQRPECASVLTRSPRGPQISRGLDLGTTHGERARRPVALLFGCVSLDNLDKDVRDLDNRSGPAGSRKLKRGDGKWEADAAANMSARLTHNGVCMLL